MNKFWWMTLTIGMALVLGCGGDDDDTDTMVDEDEQHEEDAGPPPEDLPPGAVGCARQVCMPPAGSTQMACCKDPFEGICGVRIGMGCEMPPPVQMADPRCPNVPIGAMGAFTLTSCCTPENMCGIQPPSFGGVSFGAGGCVELGRAASMAMPPDGGTGMGMFPTIMWPAPKPCG